MILKSEVIIIIGKLLEKQVSMAIVYVNVNVRIKRGKN